MSHQLQYIAMTGLGSTLDRITAATNNLANVNTTGFKAQRPVFEALPFYGQGLPDRVDVAARQDTANFSAGTVEQTGRNLDVAVNGNGWLAVQASDGSVALTRNGSLSLSATGVLQTSTGQPVLGENFTPISLPPLQSVTIGEDGTISGVPQGQAPDQVATLGRIMLVNPPAASLSRRSDGLFQDNDGQPTPDAQVKLAVGALEGSNANAVSMMINLIDNTRSFQMQTELVRLAGGGPNQGTPLTLS
ncbi:MAG TPA: flagellar basal-body rod protein FlgF [Stellaceae bacterium]|jgi:flagellar basal-body rod protein FlgF|nr:flagellar basal-body rod protein FlgF [Stellaceae bacterium]